MTVQSNKVLGFVFAAFFTLTPVAALAQNTSGGGSHGGSSVVCRTPKGKILSVELMDTFEARVRYQLTPSTEDKARVLLDAGMRILPNFYFRKQFEEFVAYFESHTVMVEEDRMLAPIHDVFPVVLPKYCKIEQLAAFDGRWLYVDSLLYSFLSKLDRVALLVHEAVYAAQRQNALEPEHIDSSEVARELTGQLTASNPDKSRITQLLKMISPQFGTREITASGARLRLTYQAKTGEILVDTLGQSIPCSGISSQMGAELTGPMTLKRESIITGLFKDASKEQTFKFYSEGMVFSSCLGLIYR